jgi:hypothetical protein
MELGEQLRIYLTTLTAYSLDPSQRMSEKVQKG